ncbi:class II histone deacetylase [Sporosarcina sp. ACRSM]|uniref:class II histone deacetylase n=1 Tax=Sporosarcina sp. ACRSM TaxID=2918216 RepID=UPI001EF5DDEE|nr:class II histone deacetylase [Sporosarcina sp. ACRSM]MCG7335804.1 class II histone deacetylase [Sporosarcina sp. ACRSM]
MKKTGFLCHESYFWHYTGNGAMMAPVGGWIEADAHSENPATKRRVKNLLERSGFINRLEALSPRAATREEIGWNHSAEYIDRVEELSNTTGGDAGDLAIVGPDSYEIALLSTGGTLTAIDAVMEGTIENAYALTRPPGHHAEKEKGMGFCLFNNAAIAAKYARKKHGVERVLILDWDVHHGNGTESSFYDDPNVLFISLHQEYTFPKDRGHVSDVGEGEGKGYNINIPLPAGTGNTGYLYAFEELIVPVVEEFKPELILISAGQDASKFDPLGRMLVDAEGYKQMAIIMKQLAEKHCHGRLVALHEGGYSAAYVPFCTLKIIEGLSGLDSGVEDPFPDVHVAPFYANQKEAIDKAIDIQSAFWPVLKDKKVPSNV